jgi:hypothetical protein
MTKMYKIIDIDGSVVRIFSSAEEAERFKNLDRCLRIETIKVFRQKKKDNDYVTAYKILGDGLL